MEQGELQALVEKDAKEEKEQGKKFGCSIVLFNLFHLNHFRKKYFQ